ncbi:MAG: UDP-3-O-(3-hydroxymyristoyl)glucosamine N-acyltransferase [Elusimicrobiota bacterium]|jgi:UDP-3-O-[3-hydroxymyristoyl] glucosamine N-acyltransferase|nr:UDP-3-O-(3-hydroxymyristoyl)glucosamine N-acyltransferase [Elusimicrobiota bacterium]
MKLTAKEISLLTDGEIIGDDSIIIAGLNGLDKAQKSDISFLGNMKYLSEALKTQAGAIFIQKDLDAAQFKDKTIIKVANPQYAYGILLGIIDRERIESYSPQIHPSSQISDSAELGEDLYIGQNAVIESNAKIGSRSKIFANVYIGRNVKIGADCIIYPNVAIRENVSIGNRVIIQPGAVIGGDGFGFASVDGKTHKIAQIGLVEIGDGVEIGSNTAIDRATVGVTKIGAGTKIDNLVMIAHNVEIGENCLIVAQVGISGSTKIGNNVTIAGQAGIVGHLKIGNNVLISAQSGISGDIADNMRVGGNPMSELNHSIKVRALIRKLPEIYQEIKNLKKSILQK